MFQKKAALVSILSLFFIFILTPCYASKLYFPHVATIDGWQTEICAINDGSADINVAFEGFNNQGQSVEIISRRINAYGREELDVAKSFSNPNLITYIVAESASGDLQGYTKFFIKNLYRGSVEASSTAYNDKIYIPHIASDHEWWTGIGILNTTGELIRPQIKFNTGRVETLELHPYEKTAFLISDLVSNNAAANIATAVIENAQGAIAFELFGTNGIYNDWCLSGISLDSSLAKTIYYPHIASDHEWWTGIVAYNPNGFDAHITLHGYNNHGNLLQTKIGTIPAHGRLVQLARDLELHPNTAWLSLSSDQPLTGFELFGTHDGETLSGYECTNLNLRSGILPKIDHEGWTGIVFVNPGDSPITLSLDAIKNSGEIIGQGSVTTVELDPRKKIVHLVPESIADADYIRFQASGDVLSFQINGDDLGKMADAMAALPSSSGPSEPSSDSSIDEGVEKAIEMFAGVMNLAPLAQEFMDIFGQILGNEDPNAPIVFDPPLDNLDLDNLPSNIKVTMDCGTGYVTGSGDTLTGKIAFGLSNLDIDGLLDTGKLAVNARLAADNFRRNGEFLFDGEADFDVRVNLDQQFNLNVHLAMDMINFETFAGLFDGHMELAIPSLSLLSDTIPPATISFQEFKAADFTLKSGSVALEPINENAFALNLNLNTDFGVTQGKIEITTDTEGSTLMVNTPSHITFGNYQLNVNNVVTNPAISLDFPTSGNIVIINGGETRILNFTENGYVLN